MQKAAQAGDVLLLMRADGEHGHAEALGEQRFLHEAAAAFQHVAHGEDERRPFAPADEKGEQLQRAGQRRSVRYAHGEGVF